MQEGNARTPESWQSSSDWFVCFFKQRLKKKKAAGVGGGRSGGGQAGKSNPWSYGSEWGLEHQRGPVEMTEENIWGQNTGITVSC